MDVCQTSEGNCCQIAHGVDSALRNGRSRTAFSRSGEFRGGYRVLPALATTLSCSSDSVADERPTVAQSGAATPASSVTGYRDDNETSFDWSLPLRGRRRTYDAGRGRERADSGAGGDWLVQVGEAVARAAGRPLWDGVRPLGRAVFVPREVLGRRKLVIRDDVLFEAMSGGELVYHAIDEGLPRQLTLQAQGSHAFGGAGDPFIAELLFADAQDLEHTIGV